MSDDLNIPAKALAKREKYEMLLPQISALIEGESDAMANIGNIMAALKYGMDWLWVGIYFVKQHINNDELVLGPFQGPVACTRIQTGKGVCGYAWQNHCVVIVDDVDKFPGHIACSALSKAEIVLPIFKSGKVIGVLDIDSEILFGLDDTDQKGLEPIITLIASCF